MFVVPGGDAAPLFEMQESTFDGVAELVQRRVESRRSAAG